MKTVSAEQEQRGECQLYCAAARGRLFNVDLASDVGEMFDLPSGGGLLEPVGFLLELFLLPMIAELGDCGASHGWIQQTATSLWSGVKSGCAELRRAAKNAALCREGRAAPHFSDFRVFVTASQHHIIQI